MIAVLVTQQLLLKRQYYNMPSADFDVMAKTLSLSLIFIIIEHNNKTYHQMSIITTIEKTMNKASLPPITNTNLQNQLQAELSEQMVELQTSMAHLEMTVERLDNIVTQQDKHIRDLQRQLQLVYKQVEGQSADEGIAPFDVMADRPPHY